MYYYTLSTLNFSRLIENNITVCVSNVHSRYIAARAVHINMKGDNKVDIIIILINVYMHVGY